MLQLNFWFFVLLANFLILLYVLNLILFKPLLRVFDEREQSVKGSLAAAKEMEAQKENALEQMRKELSEAAGRAKQQFEALRAEGQGKQRDALSAAAQEAAGIAEKARQELRAEAGKARSALRADVERFSEEIVRKLVGV
jgi:F-type H+-transporting ATPase subunit b